MNKTFITGSKHFTLHSLAEGVFAAIAEDGGAAISNSGVIDLGGQRLVFDTFLTPQAAMDLKRSASELLGQTPNIVINSHYHNDHIWGNQVFASEAQIVSSTRTRDLIATAGLEEFQWYSANSAQRLETIRADYHNSSDVQHQKQLLLWIGYYEGLVEAFPQLTVCMPGITFNKHLEIYGNKLTAELMTFEGAHTGSDMVLYLPQAKIIFMSDLLFVGSHPYLADGDPLHYLNALKELSQLEAISFVPGHGPIGTKIDLKLMIEYIEHCLETAQTMVEDGNATEERIKEIKIADQFQTWQLPQFYPINLRFLCERLSAEKEKKQD